jgi:energy-coupling factor transport system permease protein
VFRTPYRSLDTLVHRLDPRTKLISLLLGSGIVFCFNHPGYVAAIALAVLAVAAAARCLGTVARLGRVLLVLFTVNVLIWLLTTGGNTTLVRFGPLRLTVEGLTYGVGASFRFVVILVVSVVFVSCTSTEDVSAGLGRLRVPFPVTFVVSTAMRLVPTFVTSARTVVEAQAARGLSARSRNPLVRFRQLLPVLVPLVMYALRHAAQMSVALEARGFSLRGPRTSYRTSRLAVRDAVALVVLGVVAVTCLTLRLRGFGTVIPGRI